MSNQLDEMNGPTLENGRDVNVINQRIPVKIGAGTKAFIVILWLLFIIPGLIFMLKKVRARTYLAQVEQKMQHNASQIDNYLEQRVIIMQNMASIVSKSVELDKDVMKTVAAYRSGVNINEDTRNDVATNIDTTIRGLHLQIENYPDLKAHSALRDAIQQNSYLQKEITAAREIYNDTILEWNSAIQEWPTKMVVAAEKGYTTRTPFATSSEVKQQARQNFFE